MYYSANAGYKLKYDHHKRVLDKQPIKGFNGYVLDVREMPTKFVWPGADMQIAAIKR